MIKVLGKTKKQRMKFMLNYVANHYNRNNRSLNKYPEFRGCEYITDDGEKRCAIGLFIPDECIGNITNHNITAKVLMKIYPQIANCTNFKGIKIGFLLDLQELHDDEFYWDNDGINRDGKKLVTEISNRWLL